jgi:hypothetical protein
MWPFGSKGGNRGIPTNRVIALSSQGLPDIEIIKALRNEGYSPAEVDTAMKQSLKGAVGRSPAQQQPPSGYPPSPSRFRGAREAAAQETSDELPPPTPPEAQRPPGQPAPPANAASLGMPPLPGEPGFEEGSRPPLPFEEQSPEFPEPPGPEYDEPIPRLREPSRKDDAREDRRRMVEEMVEGIIEEKWGQLMRELDDMRSQFTSIQEKVMVLEDSLRKADNEKKTEFGVIEEKIDSYKQSISEVSNRMGAVENAMKHTMTPMMHSMRSLTNAVKHLNDRQGAGYSSLEFDDEDEKTDFSPGRNKEDSED